LPICDFVLVKLAPLPLFSTFANNFLKNWKTVLWHYDCNQNMEKGKCMVGDSETRDYFDVFHGNVDQDPDFVTEFVPYWTRQF
jgi:hypothetical protein